MGFTQCLKRPMEILFKKTCSASSGRAYSTSMARRGNLFSSHNVSTCPCCPKPFNSLQIYFTRHYSSEISASAQTNLIKQLRERTSAPIKDVKSALVACNWDIEAAQTDLRKRGVALASKKSSRTAAEGLLALAQDEKQAILVELNCETDFVARNEIFQYLASSLAKSALPIRHRTVPSEATTPIGPDSLGDLKMVLDHPKLSGEKTVENAITDVAAMMGENVKLGWGFYMTAPAYGVLSTYLHSSPQPGVGRIAGIVCLEVQDKNAPLDAVHRVGSELAMHVVAAKPIYLAKEHVTSDALAKEREILRSQAEGTGKSQMAIDKMVDGRLRKYYEEVVLLEQKFVVNDALNIKTLLDNLSKEVGSKVTVGNFLRVEVGEGEKVSTTYEKNIESL